MPKYKYQAISEGGSSVSGSIEASSEEVARELLIARNMIPSKVQVDTCGGGGFAKQLERMTTGVKTPELILFTKQFRTLFDAGISIISLLEVLEHQSENPLMTQTVVEIATDIREGSTLYQSFSKHGRIFNPLYCSMLKAGEMAGTLPEVLERLIYLIEHEYKVKKQIQSAMVYPVLVIFALVGAFLFLLTFVIP
jgi:type II secretory pathway component PulF